MDGPPPEQPNAAHRRINEAGHSVPSSHDLRDEGRSEPAYLGLPASPAALPAPPPSTTMAQEAQAVHPLCAGVVQLPPLNGRPQMDVSCSVWGRNTEVSCCLQTVFGNCAGLVPPGLCCLWDHQVAAVSPVQLLRKRHSSLRALRWGRQPGRQDAAATSMAAGQQLPQSSQPVPPAEPLDDSPLPNCPCSRRRSDRAGQAIPHRPSPGLGDGTPSVRGLSIRYGLGRKPGRSREWSPVLGFDLLDAIVSFAGVGQKGRLFPDLDTLTIKWATGRTCRKSVASCSIHN